jgi:hypothetical protein
VKNRSRRKQAEGERPVPATETQPRPAAAPSREDIARRAYEIYVARGSEGGDPVADWLAAEQELLHRR